MVAEGRQVVSRGVAVAAEVDADRGLAVKVAGEVEEAAGLLLYLLETSLHKFQQGSQDLIFKT